MKRFTETSKWGDPWWRRLSSPAKQLQGYLWDNCNQIGLIEVDFTLVSGDCGQKIDEANMAELGERVQSIGAGKYFLPKFIHFQYGELSEGCPPHKTILKLVRLHNLQKSGLLYLYPNATLALPTRQDKKGQERTRGGTGGLMKKPEIEEVRLFCSKSGISESDADWFFHKCEGNGWTNGGKPIRRWGPTLTAWKVAGYLPSQKQSGNGHASGADTIVTQKEYERVMARMNKIRENYGDHQSWAKQDIEEFQKLKKRGKELKETLGVVI